MLGAKMSLM